MNKFRTTAIQTVISFGIATATQPVFAHASALASALPPILAKNDISDQRMKIYVDGAFAYERKVSTAWRGYVTPTGAFRPYGMHKIWYSRKYDYVPMPHSVFLNGGYAVRTTDAVSQLGHPAPHGCVRLDPANAKTFFNLVSQYGKFNA